MKRVIVNIEFLVEAVAEEPAADPEPSSEEPAVEEVKEETPAEEAAPPSIEEPVVEEYVSLGAISFCSAHFVGLAQLNTLTTRFWSTKMSSGSRTIHQ
jgi:hypothetical protein